MTEREEIYGEDPTPPISVTGLPCMDASWIATDAEAQAKVLTTKVISCANLAALGASDTFAGLIELASDAEAQAKALTTRALTPANLAILDATEIMSGLVERATVVEANEGTDGTRYVSPAGLLMRRITATGAIIGGDLTGDPRGVNGLDIQAARTAITQVASGYESVAIGSNATASGYNTIAIGNDVQATYLNAIAIGENVVASGGKSICIGENNTASGYNATAIGVGIVASGVASVALGFSVTASAYGATAFGSGTTASGNYSMALAYGALASGIESVAIGRNSVANADYTVAIGPAALALGIGASAIGAQSEANIAYTTNISSPLISRKDNGEAANLAQRTYCSAEVIFMSKQINLEAVADQTLTLPAGCHFYPNEVGIIATAVTGAIVTQPTVRFGWTGTLAGLVAAIITTALTALFTRERFTTLLNYNGQTSLTGGVTIAGSGGTYMGRFYWKGLLIEDE